MHIKTAWIVGLVLLAAADVRAEPPICTCRYAGQSYLLGTCVCIVTPNGARRACCDKVLNNTSWSFKGDTCPLAGALPLVAETSPPGSPEEGTHTKGH